MDSRMLRRLVAFFHLATIAHLAFGQQAIEQSSKAVFAQALGPRQWQFPRDHGQHAEFRTEWWYFTGNLSSPAGRRFGYQLTFFRTALLPEPVPRDSRWAFRDAYFSHFTITDIADERFYYDQRLARGTLALANSALDSLDVYVGNWSARGGNTVIRLKAQARFGNISFELENRNAPVLHGRNGLMRKSPQLEDASYYYSQPHLRTTGTLQLADQAFQLEGLSWMDHEFFTGPEQGEFARWDWMSLHLSDSTALMLYLLRSEDGELLPQSGGTIILASGATHTVGINDFDATPVSWWTSSKTGGKYPIRWQIRIGAYQLELTAPVNNQELDTRPTTGVIYWEGYVEARGKKAERPIRGDGYLEMTGYAHRAEP